MPLLDSFWWCCSILKKTRHFIETNWVLQKPFWCFQELCKCCSGSESAKQGNKQGNKPNKFRIDRTPTVWGVFYMWTYVSTQIFLQCKPVDSPYEAIFKPACEGKSFTPWAEWRMSCDDAHYFSWFVHMFSNIQFTIYKMTYRSNAWIYNWLLFFTLFVYKTRLWLIFQKKQHNLASILHGRISTICLAA